MASDGLRSMRWRAATLLVGLGLVFAWVRLSGRTSYTIQVDYSWARGVLDSAAVEIDGAVAGHLQPYGRSNFVTGFRVDAGEHVVRVSTERCEGVVDTVRLDPRGARVAVLVADVDDGYRCRVVLRGN